MEKQGGEATAATVQELFSGGFGDAARRLGQCSEPHLVGAVARAFPDLTEDEARDLAFHLSDWREDAAFLLAMSLAPERFSAEDLSEGLMAFVTHAPNHVMAAANIAGFPASDIFADSTAHKGRMLADCTVVAFVATRDAAKARPFYEEVLGLRLISDEPWAIVFEAGGTTIRVQKVDSFEPHPFTALGWNVSDIDATVDALAARQVLFRRFPGMTQDDRGVWASPSGARVAWFKDPDGNVLSLTQL